MPKFTRVAGPPRTCHTRVTRDEPCTYWRLLLLPAEVTALATRGPALRAKFDSRFYSRQEGRKRAFPFVFLYFYFFFRLGCPAWANFILCPHSCPSWVGSLARLGGLVAISQVGFALITQGVATRAFLRWNPVYLLKIEFSQKTQT